MAPPNRRRSILKQKNNDDETENFRANEAEESQWANVTQSARKRVSFSAKNQVKEFAKNCSSDNSNLSSDMDMTVCRERSMHEQNGDFDDELQSSAMEITTHSAAVNNASPETNTTGSSSHVFVTPALKGTALSKSSVSFVTSTPAASSSPMLVTPKMAKRNQGEDIKITPISHPYPAEPHSVEKGRTLANQTLARSNMSVTCLKSPEHTVYGGIDMSIIQEAASTSPEKDSSFDMFEKSGRSSNKTTFGSLDMNISREDQMNDGSKVAEDQPNSRRKTTFEPVDMSVCEEPKNDPQDTVLNQGNARRKTTFEPADMSVCEEQKNENPATDQHQGHSRRKTTFEPANMSVCEEPKIVHEDKVLHQGNARRKTTFEPADMSVCEEQKNDNSGTVQHQGNSRRKTTFEPAEMSVCEESRDVDQNTVQHHRNPRRKTTFESHDMSYEEQPDAANEMIQSLQQSSQMSMTFAHPVGEYTNKLCPRADAEHSMKDPSKSEVQSNVTGNRSHLSSHMSMTSVFTDEAQYYEENEGPVRADQQALYRVDQQYEKNSDNRRNSLFKPQTSGSITSSQQDVPDVQGEQQIPADEVVQNEILADQTKIFDMSMELSFGSGSEPETREPLSAHTQSIRAHHDGSSTTNMSMTRIVDATQNRSKTVGTTPQQPNYHEKLTMTYASNPAEPVENTLPKSNLPVAGPIVQTTVRKMVPAKAPSQSLGWLSDPAFAPKIYSKSTLATGQMAPAAAPSVPSVTHFGKFGCAKTPKRLIPMDVLSAEMLAGMNEENKEQPIQEAKGTPKVHEKQPARRPQKRVIQTTAETVEVNVVPAPALSQSASQSQKENSLPNHSSRVNHQPCEVSQTMPSTSQRLLAVKSTRTPKSVHGGVETSHCGNTGNQPRCQPEASNSSNFENATAAIEHSAAVHAALPPISSKVTMKTPVASSARTPEDGINQSTGSSDNAAQQTKPVMHKPSPILPPVGFVEMEMESPKAPPAKKPALALTSNMQQRPDENGELGTPTASNLSPARKRGKAMNKTYVMKSPSDKRSGPSVACVFNNPVSRVTEMTAPRTNLVNTPSGPRPFRTASPVAVIPPMNRTYINTPPEASMYLPPSQTLPWDTTCPLGGELTGKKMANGSKAPASPAPVNETFVVEPELDNQAENDNIFEPSIRFERTIKEEPENETLGSLPPKLSLSQRFAPSKYLKNTLEDLHLSKSVGAAAVHQNPSGELNLTHGGVLPSDLCQSSLATKLHQTQPVAASDSLQKTLTELEITQAGVIQGRLENTLVDLNATEGIATSKLPPGTAVEETASIPQDVTTNGTSEPLILHRPVTVTRQSSEEQLLEDMVQPEDLTQDLSFGCSQYVSFAAPPPPSRQVARPSRSISPAQPSDDQSLFQSSVMDSPTSPQQPGVPQFNLPPMMAAASQPSAFPHVSIRPHNHHHREPDPRFPTEVQALLKTMMTSRGVRKMKAAEKLWRHPAVPLHLQADLYEQLKQYLPSIFCSQDWRY